jgi:hypothetical protein
MASALATGGPFGGQLTRCWRPTTLPVFSCQKRFGPLHPPLPDCHSSHETSLGRRWSNRVNEGLTGKRLQGGEPESCLRSSRSDFAPARRRRPPHSESPLWLLYTRASETRSNATGRKTGAAPNDTRQRVRITRRCARLLVESDAQTILGPPRHRRDPQ